MVETNSNCIKELEYLETIIDEALIKESLGDEEEEKIENEEFNYQNEIYCKGEIRINNFKIKIDNDGNTIELPFNNLTILNQLIENHGIDISNDKNKITSIDKFIIDTCNWSITEDYILETIKKDLSLIENKNENITIQPLKLLIYQPLLEPKQQQQQQKINNNKKRKIQDVNIKLSKKQINNNSSSLDSEQINKIGELELIIPSKFSGGSVNIINSNSSNSQSIIKIKLDSSGDDNDILNTNRIRYYSYLHDGDDDVDGGDQNNYSEINKVKSGIRISILYSLNKTTSITNSVPQSPWWPSTTTTTTEEEIIEEHIDNNKSFKTVERKNVDKSTIRKILNEINKFYENNKMYENEPLVYVASSSSSSLSSSNENIKEFFQSIIDESEFDNDPIIIFSGDLIIEFDSLINDDIEEILESYSIENLEYISLNQENQIQVKIKGSTSILKELIFPSLNLENIEPFDINYKDSKTTTTTFRERNVYIIIYLSKLKSLLKKFNNLKQIIIMELQEDLLNGKETDTFENSKKIEIYLEHLFNSAIAENTERTETVDKTLDEPNFKISKKIKEIIKTYLPNHSASIYDFLNNKLIEKQPKMFIKYLSDSNINTFTIDQITTGLLNFNSSSKEKYNLINQIADIEDNLDILIYKLIPLHKSFPAKITKQIIEKFIQNFENQIIISRDSSYFYYSPPNKLNNRNQWDLLNKYSSTFIDSLSKQIIREIDLIYKNEYESFNLKELQTSLSNNIIENYDENIAYEVITIIFSQMISSFKSNNNMKLKFNLNSYQNILLSKICTNEFISKYDNNNNNYKLLSFKIDSKLNLNQDNLKMKKCINQINQFLEDHQETDKTFKLKANEKEYLLKQLPMLMIFDIQIQQSKSPKNHDIKIIKIKKYQFNNNNNNNNNDINIITVSEYDNYLLKINNILKILKILPTTDEIQNLIKILESKLLNKLDYLQIEFDGNKTIYPSPSFFD